MQVEQVEIVDVETAERILALFADEVGRAVGDKMDGGEGADFDASLGGDDDVLAADLVERVADDLLLTDDGGGETKETPRVEEGVNVGGVPQSDTASVNLFEEGDDVVVWELGAVGCGEAHAAVAHLGDNEALRA